MMPADIEKILSAYEELPEIRKLILLIFSVLYREATQKSVLDCLSSADFRSLGKETVHGKNFREHLNSLADKSLLLLENGKSYICNPLISEIIIRKSLHDDELKVIFKTVEEFTTKAASVNYGFSHDVMFRLARIALYRGDGNLYASIEKIHNSFRYRIRYEYPPVHEVLSVMLKPFDPVFIKSFHFTDNHYELLFSSFIMDSFFNSEVNSDIIEFLVKDCMSEKPESGPALIDFLCQHLLLQGRFSEVEEIERLRPDMVSEFSDSIKGIRSFFKGEMDAALVSFDSAIASAKKREKKRNYIFSSYVSILYYFILLNNGEEDHYKKALDYSRKIASDAKHPFYLPFFHLHTLTLFISGAESYTIPVSSRLNILNYWNVMMYAFLLLWMKPENAAGSLPALKKMLKLSEKMKYKWIEMQMHDLIWNIEKNETSHSSALKLKKELNSVFLTELIRRKENWEIALNALSALTPKQKSELPAGEKSKRLAWLLDFDKSLTVCRHIQPVEQSFNDKKGWSNGRNVALKRLKNDWAKIDYLTEQDRRVIPHIDVYTYGYYGETEYVINSSALVELAGHPLLFDQHTEVPIEIVNAEPELRVSEAGIKKLKISFYPENVDENEKFKLIAETPLRFRVYRLTTQHKKMVKILGTSGLEVPEEHKEKVLSVITSLSGSISIQSDIAGEGSHAEFVEPDTRPYILIMPFGEGLKFAAYCRPFAGEGPYYKPGKGGKNVITDLSGRKVRTTRDLTREEGEVSEMLNLCPVMQSRINGEEYEWIFDDTETCLQALVELQDAGERVVIEWPEGERFRVRSHAGINGFHMNIRKDNDWFSLSGELDLENGEIMEMRKLLDLLDQTPGRFIKMSDGSFVALTEKFRKQLDELKSYSEASKSGLRFSPLVAPLIDEMASLAAGLKADKEWTEHLERLKELKNFKPELPVTLQAELRDYQMQGFEWLARLSHWGVGACLADDMGLGKTVQALAVMLTRASQGPSLVVAPASVCINWFS